MTVDRTSRECSTGIRAGVGACGTVATTCCRDSGIDTPRCGTTICGRVSWKCSLGAGANVDSSPAAATCSVDEDVHDVRKIVSPVILRATPKHTAMRRAKYHNPGEGFLLFSNVLGNPWQSAHSYSDMPALCIHMML